jgi:hypothetical protein
MSAYTTRVDRSQLPAISYCAHLCASTDAYQYDLGFRSKQHTYDDVVERVALQVGLEDPAKVRLTSHNCYSQQPKPQPIKYRGVERLSDMLVHYNQVSHASFT